MTRGHQKWHGKSTLLPYMLLGFVAPANNRKSMALLDIVKCDRNVSRENDRTTSWKNVLQMF